ncbi:putative cell differentiation protein RCD1 -like protein [Capsicum annuum]|nr:putative cell differentiation protein RCD1 -like protein [Capsicum annuum]KAF3681482.1 putative cell differentiation protein RCD1 -like protein [Capsicum annuum]
MKESKIVEVFIQEQDETYYQHLLPALGKTFIEVLRMGEMIEDGIKTGRIVSFATLKMTTQAIQKGLGNVGGKKNEEDVATIVTEQLRQLVVPTDFGVKADWLRRGREKGFFGGLTRQPTGLVTDGFRWCVFTRVFAEDPNVSTTYSLDPNCSVQYVNKKMNEHTIVHCSKDTEEVERNILDFAKSNLVAGEYVNLMCKLRIETDNISKLDLLSSALPL